ncbi:MAG: hypothetical protein ABI162_08260 [Luteolibacter sp.]
MKTLYAIALCSILGGLPISNAVEDPVAHSSPDGSVTIRNVGDTAAADHHFQIASRSGEVLLTSDNRSGLESGSFAEEISWSPDSHYVAFSVRTSGPYIRDTFVYSTRSKHLMRIPTEDQDYQTRPVRWCDARTLVVQTNAPFGGNASEENGLVSYHYRRTIRLSENPLRLDTLYTSQRSHPK